MSRNYQNHPELYPEVAAQDPDVHYLKHMSYTLERQIYGVEGSPWETVETFEDLELADKELGLLQTRSNDTFRIINTDD